MKFRALCSVHLRHPYYTDGQCPDFAIEPTLSTQRLLTNARCVLKMMPHGVRVLTTVTDQGMPLPPLRQDTPLVFHLRLQNPDFVLFTDLTERPATAPLYTNDGLRAGADLQLALQPRRNGIPDPGVFADIVIYQNDTVPPRANTPGAFAITFNAKKMHWTYYLITNPRQTADAWQIVDTDADETPPLTFSAMNRTDLTQSSAPTDAVATRLAAQYPDTQRWRLVSDAPLPCQQAARQHLQLHYHGQPVWETLPHPALQHYATVDVNGSPQPQETLFHVIHLTHASPTTGV